ncbi:MAG: hypothetical protein KatS3mg129_1870 [Leptospiraceae bacterium]|nr:MAG: hypothetical protein KatS3mg129_1870 [Leptospiraceae bacterium]
MQERKWYQKRSIIFTIHILAFIGFIIFYETYNFLNAKEETKNLSKLIQSFVWNLDDASAKQYLNVYIQNKNIDKVKILHKDKTLFLEVNNEKQHSVLYDIFSSLYLIRKFNLSSSIYFEKEKIGYIIITWINENIFIYFYALFIFILLSFVAYFYVETVIQKNLLNQAFEEIKALKIQQDADYYLTSLLIKPLTYIDLKSNYYKCEYFIKQKKQFEYKRFKDEIGGDFIIVKQIQLRKRKYIFFINADAMGKSLQGGSGILVLGSILYAIFKRLEIRIEDKNKYPETWLKYLSLELQELFESFQGSMLVSSVIGLIDELTGILYYVNFEHPYPVIYRNGKAYFIGENYILRKIGMPRMFQQEVKIQIYELQENDIFIVGSDGKDDLEIEINQQERIINEDETLFLRIVEQSEGDLNLILKNIQNKGKIIDDISILIFHILKKEIPVIGNLAAKETTKIKEKIKNYINNKNYKEVYNFLSIYVNEYPLDNELLYYYAAISYKLTKYHDAIDIGEVLLNRINPPIPLFPLLIKSYIKINNLNRAKTLLEELKKYNYDQNKIKQLEENITKQSEIIKDKI